MRPSDISAGSVAYLDTDILNRDPVVVKHSSHVPRNGPFVCVWSSGEVGLWASLVGRQTQYSARLEILPRWRTGGTDIWRTTPHCFLGDGATTYYGPHASFVRAAHIDQYYIVRKYAPPRITEEGIRAIMAIVRKRGGDAMISGKLP